MHQFEQGDAPDVGSSEIRGRLESLEEVVADSAAVLRQLLTAVNGAMANQRAMAENQAKMITVLARSADRLEDDSRKT